MLARARVLDGSRAPAAATVQPAAPPFEPAPPGKIVERDGKKRL
jgi:hypothetical protein